MVQYYFLMLTFFAVCCVADAEKMSGKAMNQRHYSLFSNELLSSFLVFLVVKKQDLFLMYLNMVIFFFLLFSYLCCLLLALEILKGKRFPHHPGGTLHGALFIFILEFPCRNTSPVTDEPKETIPMMNMTSTALMGEMIIDVVFILSSSDQH